MRTVRAFGKELSEVNTYTQKTDQVLTLARREAVLRAAFFGVVRKAERKPKAIPTDNECLFSHTTEASGAHSEWISNKNVLRVGVFQTGLSGNIMILSVLYKGGLLMASQHMTVGELSSFLMYTFWVGISIAGSTCLHITHVTRYFCK